MSELTQAEKLVFGENATRDPDTGQIIETGLGADHAAAKAEQARRAAEAEAEHGALVDRAEKAEAALAESEALRLKMEAEIAALTTRAEKAEADLASKSAKTGA